MPQISIKADLLTIVQPLSFLFNQLFSPNLKATETIKTNYNT